MIYSGIGARETPIHIQQKMTLIAERLSLRDYKLRSGGARGADTAFNNGAVYKDVYLPYDGFNGHQCRVNPDYYDCEDFENYSDAIDIVRRLHPSGKYLKGFSLQAHARNCYVILGARLNEPSKFVVCWTKDGFEYGQMTRESGGTGMGVLIANLFDIPVINMYNSGWSKRIGNLV